eukprot:m.357169 g.357169  ORF g.357169 m.357169 type:complete len:862 (+) comp17737_c0_seq1:530-3115(+)
MSGVDEILIVAGRRGHADFINGQYNHQEGTVAGKPFYCSDHTIPEGYEEAEGYQLYLYFHEENDAWVISHVLNELDVIAYAPTHLKNTWYVATGKGTFLPDPTVKIVSGTDGRVMTRLAPWSVDPDGEVAMKLETEPNAGSEQPRTILEAFQKTVEKVPESNATCRVSPSGQWEFRNYRQMYEDCDTLAKAFVTLGLRQYHSVIIMGTNAPEWGDAALAATMAGGCACGVFESVTENELFSIVEQSRCDIMVVDNDQQMQKAMAVRRRCPQLKAICQYIGNPGESGGLYSWPALMEVGSTAHADAVEEYKLRQRSLRANRCAVIAFTPGTSEDPKGVLLSHDNITWTARAASHMMGAELSSDKVVSFLPLANMTVQMMDLWMPLMSASTVHFGSPDPLNGLAFLDTLDRVHPTVFLCSPWLWRRLMIHCQGVKKVSAWAARKGAKGSVRKQTGEKTSWKFNYAEKTTFSKLKRSLGLQDCRLAFSFDSNLDPDIATYFFSINLPVYELYGCAESSGIHTMSLPTFSKRASAGLPLYGTQVRLQQGTYEMLLYGRSVMMGYLYNVEMTAEAIDARGWFHSKDMGQSDRAGAIYVTGRQKDLIQTAGGSFVPPGPIQHHCKHEFGGLINNVILVGSKRKSLGVLLTFSCELDAEFKGTDKLSAEAQECLKGLGINIDKVSMCMRSPNKEVILRFIDDALSRVNDKAVSPAQRVEKFEILERELCPPFELGPTFKTRRAYILHRYQEQIERMYQGEEVDDYESQPWYHGTASRAEVTALLKRDGGGYDGWYLVRLSTKEKNTFVISLCFKGKLYHNQIRYQDGIYSTHKDQGNHQYNSLGELIDHHRAGKNGFQTVLTSPCKRK